MEPKSDRKVLSVAERNLKFGFAETRPRATLQYPSTYRTYICGKEHYCRSLRLSLGVARWQPGGIGNLI